MMQQQRKRDPEPPDAQSVFEAALEVHHPGQCHESLLPGDRSVVGWWWRENALRQPRSVWNAHRFRG